MQIPKSRGTCRRRTDGEGGALAGDRGSGPGHMRRSFQSGCLATSGENRKWSGLGGVEAEGGRRLEMEGESVGVGEGQGAPGAEAQAEGRGAFCFYIFTRKDWNHCREWDAGSVKGSVPGSSCPLAVKPLRHRGQVTAPPPWALLSFPVNN